MQKILVNKIKCNKCGDIIESKSRNDFRTCSCGAVSVDGGLDYIRRCGELEDYEELSVLEESEELRQEVIKKYKKESDEETMLKKIEEKLGFSIKEYNDRHRVKKEAHEQDNIPNLFEKLTMEELLFLREHKYFLE